MTPWKLRPIACALGFTILPIHAETTDSFPAPELTPQELYKRSAADVTRNARLQPNYGTAKNVILFVGDGMGVSTVTAARILAGQLAGVSGEESNLYFETLPYLAMSKTYSVNQQTSDSAPTMTAMVTGVKTNEGVLAVNHYTTRGDCDVSDKKLTTILEMAENAGKSTGVVSTARLTHATPAANYAHISDRDWESDRDVSAACRGQTVDIAAQLIELNAGDGIEVALGGGRRAFLPSTATDGEGSAGRRTDGRDLTTEWTTRFGSKSAYVWDRAGFDAVNPAKTSHLLGLFESSHMEFEHDRPTDAGGEPSLAEMTSKAIDMLKRNRKGFYLHVESGRIDHAHHAGNASRALTDTIAFADAIRVAMEKTNPRDTLIVVTADHSHVFTIAGYPKRGNNILGKVIEATDADGEYALAEDGYPYTTLTYANGKGFYTGVPGEAVYSFAARSGRYHQFEVSGLDDPADPDFHQEALVPTSAETHAGEDVAIYAGGPGAYLFQGTMEQSAIFHVMRRAMTQSDKGGHQHNDHGKDRDRDYKGK